ncbi:MAG: biotin carboxylase N-terminal domain-containing protein, partial [bacterium]
MERKIQKILIANRGVPAVRVMHTCRDRKIPTTAVYSTPDRLAHHVFMADTAVHIGEAPPAESYLNMDKMIDAALRSRSDAIHPGWGFLAENEAFARKVIDAGLLWIGPRPEVIRAMGDKIRAKDLARKAHVPTIPGISNVKDAEQIKQWMKGENIR